MAEIREQFDYWSSPSGRLRIARSCRSICDVNPVRRRNCRLLLVKRAGRARQAGPAEARHFSDARRISHGRRIHHERGHYSVILCERGIRTFTDHRNTLDLSSSCSPATEHLPIVAIQPRHGKRTKLRRSPAPRLRWEPTAHVKLHHDPDKACPMACSRCFQTVRRVMVQYADRGGSGTERSTANGVLPE